MAWSNTMPSYTWKNPSDGSMKRIPYKAKGLHYADRAPKANVVYAKRPAKALAHGPRKAYANGQKNGFLSIGAALKAKSQRVHGI